MPVPAPSASQPIEAIPTPSEQLLVNLQIVSPSVSVNRPLLFPELPATTTIKCLKDKIRQTLPLRPADDSQRLIHRGRALLRESDTLLDVFGSDALHTLDRQTIHLVIRDLTDGQSWTPPTTTSRGQSPADGGPSTGAPRTSFGPEPPSSFPRRSHFQASIHAIPQPGVSSTAPAHHHNPEQAAAFQQHHQNMTNWLGQVQRDAQLQREAMVRALVNQNQRGRAQMGMRGMGDPTSGGLEANGGRVSPGASLSTHYETMGPNGQGYQVDTVFRSGTQGTPVGLSSAEAHNMLRSADSNQAAMAMVNAMQRNASGATLFSRPLTQPGVTTPILGAGGSLAGSGRATPELDPRLAGAAHPPPARANSPGLAQQGPQIYLLLSPEGPRALLFNSPTAETFLSPRIRSQASLQRPRSTGSSPNVGHVAQPSGAHAAPPQEPGRPPRDDAAAAHAQPMHPNNPAAAGFPPLLLQLWPHLWLIFRLGLFVWFFTSPNSSWSRLLTIICLAVLMFVLSTGLLNGLVENAWGPIGRHLENILPGLEPRRDATSTGRGRGRVAEGGHGQVEPEQLAARLIAERSARRGLVVRLLRRVERAGLLFLASLAPGVAERHIANLEAEARAEESRRREAEAAAAQAAQAAQAAADGASGEAEARGEVNHASTEEPQHDGREEHHGEKAGHEAPRASEADEAAHREDTAAL